MERLRGTWIISWLSLFIFIVANGPNFAESAEGCSLTFFGNDTSVPPRSDFKLKETTSVGYEIMQVQVIDGDATFAGDAYLGLKPLDSGNFAYSLQLVKSIGDAYDNSIFSALTGSISLTCNDGSSIPDGYFVVVQIDEENTHSPKFSVPSITMDLAQNLPVGLDLRQYYSPDESPFYATDGDRDGTDSSTVTFSIDSDFLEVTKTVSTVEYVDLENNIKFLKYTPVITLKKSLDLASDTFSAILTASDKGEPSKHSTLQVTVNVKSANDGPPKFNELYYTSEVLPTTAAGSKLDILPNPIHAAANADDSVALAFTIIDQPANGPQFSLQAKGNNVELYLDNDVDPSWPEKVVHVVIQATREDNPAKTDTVAVTIIFTDLVTTTTSTTPTTPATTTLCPTEPPVTCLPCTTETPVTCPEPVTCPPATTTLCPTETPVTGTPCTTEHPVTCPEPITCPPVTTLEPVTCPPVTTVEPVTCPTVAPPEPVTCPTGTPEPVTCPVCPTAVTCPTLPTSTSTATSCPACICTTDSMSSCPTAPPCPNITTERPPITCPTTPTGPSDSTCPPCPTWTPTGSSSTSTDTSTSSSRTTPSMSTINDLTTICPTVTPCDCTTPVTSSASTAPSTTDHSSGSTSASTSHGTTLCPTPEPSTTTCAPCDCTTTISVSSTSQGTTTLTPHTNSACPSPTPCICTTTSHGTTDSTVPSSSSTTSGPTTPVPDSVAFKKNQYAADFLESQTGANKHVVTVEAESSNSAYTITYDLSGDDSSDFDITQHGVITMVRELFPKTYAFQAVAIIPNGASDLANITVEVLATVDPSGAPRFNQSVFTGTLVEKTTSENVAQVFVWDSTDVQFNKSRVSPDSLHQNFEVDPVSGVVSCVIAVSREEATSVQVTVWATRDVVSEAVVVITIDDVNDSPEFNRSEYVVGYPKRTYIDQAVSMPVYRFQAEDGDVGENAALAYELISTGPDTSFYVESNTGILYATYSDIEDRCQSIACEYKINVRDRNGAGLNATASVSIWMLNDDRIQVLSIQSTKAVDIYQISSELTGILGYTVEPLHASASTLSQKLRASSQTILYLYAVNGTGYFITKYQFSQDIKIHSAQIDQLDWSIASTNEAALPTYAARDVISDLEQSNADLTVATGVLGALFGLAVLGALGFVFFVYYWKDRNVTTGVQRDSFDKNQKILASSRHPEEEEDEPNGSEGNGGQENYAYVHHSTENETRANSAESVKEEKKTSFRDEVIVTVQPPTPDPGSDPFRAPVEEEIYSPESPKPKKSIIKTDTTLDDKKDGAGATNGSKSIKFNPNPDVIQLSSTGGAILTAENAANNPDIEMEAM